MSESGGDATSEKGKNVRVVYPSRQGYREDAPNLYGASVSTESDREHGEAVSIKSPDVGGLGFGTNRGRKRTQFTEQNEDKEVDRAP